MVRHFQVSQLNAVNTYSSTNWAYVTSPDTVHTLTLKASTESEGWNNTGAGIYYTLLYAEVACSNNAARPEMYPVYAEGASGDNTFLNNNFNVKFFHDVFQGRDQYWPIMAIHSYDYTNPFADEEIKFKWMWRRQGGSGSDVIKCTNIRSLSFKKGSNDYLYSEGSTMSGSSGSWTVQGNGGNGWLMPDEDREFIVINTFTKDTGGGGDRKLHAAMYTTDYDETTPSAPTNSSNRTNAGYNVIATAVNQHAVIDESTVYTASAADIPTQLFSVFNAKVNNKRQRIHQAFRCMNPNGNGQNYWIYDSQILLLDASDFSQFQYKRFDQSADDHAIGWDGPDYPYPGTNPDGTDAWPTTSGVPDNRYYDDRTGDDPGDHELTLTAISAPQAQSGAYDYQNDGNYYLCMGAWSVAINATNSAGLSRSRMRYGDISFVPKASPGDAATGHMLLMFGSDSSDEPNALYDGTEAAYDYRAFFTFAVLPGTGSDVTLKLDICSSPVGTDDYINNAYTNTRLNKIILGAALNELPSTTVNVYNGTSWDTVTSVHRHNGSNWDQVSLKVYDGSLWN